MQYFEELNNITPQEIFPGYRGRFVHTENITLAFWDIKAGSSVPEHSHVHEQLVTVREGQFQLIVDGVSKVLVQAALLLFFPM